MKAQIHAGGRGKAGGIKFADNQEDAYHKAQAIFKLPIKGELPKTILVEPKVTIKKEIYLAILIDRAYRGPILMASAEGGIEIETSEKDTKTGLGHCSTLINDLGVSLELKLNTGRDAKGSGQNSGDWQNSYSNKDTDQSIKLNEN